MTTNGTVASELEGILVALVTPFTADGEDVNHGAIPGIVNRVLDAGVAAVIPGGSTGEFTSLSLTERMATTESVAAANAGRARLVPHVGSVRVAEARELMRHAASLKADAVMAVPPYYDPLTWDEVVRYYAALSDVAPELPIMAYHYPSATGALITLPQVRELVERVPAVKYMKDSGGVAQLLDELLADANGTLLRVFNGSDSLTFQGLTGGASGSVWGAASFMPGLAVALFEAIHDRNDLAEGRRLWGLIRPICRSLEQNSYPAAVKAACELVGMDVGPARAPLSPLSAPARLRLSELLAAADLTDASSERP